MMRGSVDADRQATVRLRVRGTAGSTTEVGFLLDTGFDGTVILPEQIAQQLGFVHLGRDTAILADGSLQTYEMYLGQLLWHSVFQDTVFLCIGPEPLIGMGLLNGNELRIEVTPGGMVEINELP